MMTIFRFLEFRFKEKYFPGSDFNAVLDKNMVYRADVNSFDGGYLRDKEERARAYVEQIKQEVEQSK